MGAENLTSEQFSEIIKSSDKPILVDFYADWCGPCKMLAPLIEEIANENTDFKVYKVNIDNCPEIAKEYSIKSIPTLISFKNGEVYKKIVGSQSKENIISLVK